MWYTKSPQGTGNRTPRIGIIGLGYVGLPTALGYANAGNPVIGYDTSKARLATISRGQADLIPEDQELLNNPDIRARITLTASATALRTCDAILIAVPTPTDRARGLSSLGDRGIARYNTIPIDAYLVYLSGEADKEISRLSE
jgi:UDP-N-acetyl-D-mannosaminuronate dehydrogenase